MWSSTGLGPPTYRPFEFPYDEYRGGMGEFGPLGGSPVTTWGPTPPTQSTITTTQEERSEDSVRFYKNKSSDTKELNFRYRL